MDFIKPRGGGRGGGGGLGGFSPATFMLRNITFIFNCPIYTYIPKSKRNVEKKTKVKKCSCGNIF